MAPAPAVALTPEEEAYLAQFQASSPVATNADYGASGYETAPPTNYVPGSTYSPEPIPAAPPPTGSAGGGSAYYGGETSAQGTYDPVLNSPEVVTTTYPSNPTGGDALDARVISGPDAGYTTRGADRPAFAPTAPSTVPNMGFTGGGDSTYYGGVGGLTYGYADPNQIQRITPGARQQPLPFGQDPTAPMPSGRTLGRGRPQADGAGQSYSPGSLLAQFYDEAATTARAMKTPPPKPKKITKADQERMARMFNPAAASPPRFEDTTDPLFAAIQRERNQQADEARINQILNTPLPEDGGRVSSPLMRAAAMDMQSRIPAWRQQAEARSRWIAPPSLPTPDPNVAFAPPDPFLRYQARASDINTLPPPGPNFAADIYGGLSEEDRLREMGITDVPQGRWGMPTGDFVPGIIGAVQESQRQRESLAAARAQELPFQGQRVGSTTGNLGQTRAGGASEIARMLRQSGQAINVARGLPRGGGSSTPLPPPASTPAATQDVGGTSYVPTIDAPPLPLPTPTPSSPAMSELIMETLPALFEQRLTDENGHWTARGIEQGMNGDLGPILDAEGRWTTHAAEIGLIPPHAVGRTESAWFGQGNASGASQTVATEAAPTDAALVDPDAPLPVTPAEVIAVESGNAGGGGSSGDGGGGGGGRSYRSGGGGSSRSGRSGRSRGGFSFGDDDDFGSWRDLLRDFDDDGDIDEDDEKRAKMEFARRKKTRRGKRGGKRNRGSSNIPSVSTSPIRQNVLSNLSSAFGRPVGGWPEGM